MGHSQTATGSHDDHWNTVNERLSQGALTVSDRPHREHLAYSRWQRLSKRVLSYSQREALKGAISVHSVKGFHGEH